MYAKRLSPSSPAGRRPACGDRQVPDQSERLSRFDVGAVFGGAVAGDTRRFVRVRPGGRGSPLPCLRVVGREAVLGTGGIPVVRTATDDRLLLPVVSGVGVGPEADEAADGFGDHLLEGWAGEVGAVDPQ